MEIKLSIWRIFEEEFEYDSLGLNEIDNDKLQIRLITKYKIDPEKPYPIKL